MSDMADAPAVTMLYDRRSRGKVTIIPGEFKVLQES
jgi:hypothetical protein